ncbi:aminotransferase class IV [Actinotalea sp.]|uniref:aminotransferase class IV n=1 Tax=Actinotalea sp. TaxID=1872145 RepID=UPI0035679452
MNDVVVWSDGQVHAPDALLVTAVDHGITVGDGVFETCGVDRGQAFALTRHLERLSRSARGLGLAEPDLDLVRRGVAAVLEALPGAGRVRITVTGGIGPLGSDRAPSAQTVLVMAGPGSAVTSARAIRVPWVRNERSAVVGLKTTSYAENVVAVAAAHAAGADEAYLANTRGELCEGTGSNIFVERGGELLTPPLSSGCLAGITRALVLEWAAQAGLPVREAHPGELPFEVLDESIAGRAPLLLASSVRTVAPVVELDGVAIEPGSLGAEVVAMYHERAAGDLDP